MAFCYFERFFCKAEHEPECVMIRHAPSIRRTHAINKYCNYEDIYAKRLHSFPFELRLLDF